MITVFREDETIDEQRTRDHVNFLINSGIQGIVVCGSTGEFFAMSIEERKHMTELVIDEVKQRVPVYVHIGDYRTMSTIELSTHAARSGADGLLILPPYCSCPTTSQVMAHIRAVAERVDLPILLYNNPGVAGIALTPQEIKKLQIDGLISGVKLTGASLTEVQETIHLCKDTNKIYYGDDRDVLLALFCGVDGWISGIQNLIPATCRKLTDSALAMNIPLARAIWSAMLPLMRWSTHVNAEREPHWLSLIKSGLRLLGRDVGRPRRPLSDLDQRMERQLEVLLRNIESSVSDTAEHC